MKKYIISLTILLSALAMNGQEVIWKLTYDVGFPFSSTKEFADQVSWRGLSFDVERFVNDNLAVGTSISWSLFLEKESDSYYEREKILLHGTQVRYINNIPLMARISWYQPLDAMEVYVTAGIGTAWQETRREIGTWAFTGTYWHFAIAPEAGVIFPTGSTYLTAKVKYVNAFKTENGPALSYLGIGLGFAW
jgi:opacity protein-like surface antigen